ncbi:MAG: hypothetical protein KKE16_01165 [Firmicutes bacterium]|nr:hypothetical protein [Bacillota bacterium]
MKRNQYLVKNDFEKKVQDQFVSAEENSSKIESKLTELREMIPEIVRNEIEEHHKKTEERNPIYKLAKILFVSIYLLSILILVYAAIMIPMSIYDPSLEYWIALSVIEIFLLVLIIFSAIAIKTMIKDSRVAIYGYLITAFITVGTFISIFWDLVKLMSQISG